MTSSASTIGSYAIAATGWDLPPEVSRRTRVLRFVRRNFIGVIASIIVATFVFLGVFGPSVAPSDPRDIDTTQQLEAPSLEHPFGTNKLGQDVLSRIIAGARVTFLIGLMAVTIGFGTGAALGIVSGYFGRWIDYLIQRSGEAWAAFPQLILYLAFIAAFGPGLKSIAIVIAISAAFGGSRVLRSMALIIRHTDYVEAARSLGATELRLLLRHVVPNVMPLVIVGASGVFAVSVLAEAALSYLGLGVAPGTPSWGMDISGESQTFARSGHWWLVAFPGIVISLVVLGFNLMGDMLRDVLDPRLRGSR